MERPVRGDIIVIPSIIEKQSGSLRAGILMTIARKNADIILGIGNLSSP